MENKVHELIQKQIFHTEDLDYLVHLAKTFLPKGSLKKKKRMKLK